MTITATAERVDGPGPTAEQIEAMTPEQIGEAIRDVARIHPGFSGNCAAFAVVLNQVLGGDGSYVIVDSGHYQFADHVAVEIRGHIYDANGATTREKLLAEWGDDADDADDDPSTVDDFSDPTPNGDQVRRLADQASGFGARLDAEKMTAALRRRLQAELGQGPPSFGC